MLFCSYHRLPENHECPFDLKGRSLNKDLFQESPMLYQDALDFIEKDLSVAKIYEFVTTKQMDDMEATELLAHFLEISEKTEVRINSVMAFKVLKLKNKRVFDVLEGCILSDENPEVKKTALTVIKDLFPKKSKDIRNWVNGKE
jgi:hypothetical protein